MTDREEFNRAVRRTAVTTVALGFALVFGIIVLANGDWIPGAITVAAALVGLAARIPVIRKLCEGPPESSTGGGAYPRRRPPRPQP